MSRATSPEPRGLRIFAAARRATVRCVGGYAAREVLLADAPNLRSTSFTAPARKETDVYRRDAERDDAVRSARERAEAKRAEKLAVVQEQVENGSLVIRKMTDAERRRYPPRTDPQPRRGKR